MAKLPHTDESYFDHDSEGHWFWTEDWGTKMGPYASREEAEEELARYAREVLGDD